MTGLLFRKSLRESRWLLGGCSLAIFAFCWIRVWIVSRMSTDRFRTILEMLPGDWRRFLSVDLEWLVTYSGRISLAYQELIVVLCVSLWSIARGSDVVSGELQRGTMEMLLAQPVSRWKIMATHSVVAVAGCLVLALAAWGGTCAGVQTTAIKEEYSASLKLPLYLPVFGNELPLPFGETQERWVPMRDKVDLWVFGPATMNLFALGVMIAGFSTVVSTCDRYRWRTIGLVTAVLVAELLLKLAGMAMDDWEWLQTISVFTAYAPEVHTRLAELTPERVWKLWLVDEHGQWVGLAPLGQDLLLIGMGIVSLLVGTVAFCRRDLPAPI